MPTLPLNILRLPTHPRSAMDTELLRNPHVGEILKLEFLEELGMREQDLAEKIGVSRAIIENIIQGRSVLTADLDLHLCRYFSLSEGYFLRCDSKVAVVSGSAV